MQLTLHNLSKHYGSVRALADISFTVKPGKIVAVLGTHASGKSTLLRCIAGILPQTHGEIRFDNNLFVRTRFPQRRRFHFVPDTPLFFPELTLAQNITTTANIYGIEEARLADRTQRVLADFQLTDFRDAKFKKSTREQAYKSALATLVILNPELWIVDEPFASGIESAALDAFCTYARQAAAAGRIILYSTGVFDIADQFSDAACILRRGRKYAFDKLETLKNNTDGDNTLSEIFKQLRHRRA